MPKKQTRRRKYTRRKGKRVRGGNFKFPSLKFPSIRKPAETKEDDMKWVENPMHEGKPAKTINPEKPKHDKPEDYDMKWGENPMYVGKPDIIYIDDNKHNQSTPIVNPLITPQSNYATIGTENETIYETKITPTSMKTSSQQVVSRSTVRKGNGVEHSQTPIVDIKYATKANGGKTRRKRRRRHTKP